MQRICPKCRHVNEQASGSAFDECPQCGVVYAKVPQAANSRGANRPSQSNQAVPNVQRRALQLQDPSDAEVEAVQSARQARASAGGDQKRGAGMLEKIFWLWTMIAGLTAAGMILYSFSAAKSAVQQGAAAAMAVALVVVPYCLARAIGQYNR